MEHQRLGGVDHATVRVAPGAAAPATATTATAPATALLEAEHEMLLATDSVGDVHGRLGAGGIEFPDIPAIVDQHRLVALRPPGEAPCRRFRRRVPRLLTEARVLSLHAARDVGRLPGRRVVRVPMPLVEIGNELCVR